MPVIDLKEDIKAIADQERYEQFFAALKEGDMIKLLKHTKKLESDLNDLTLAIAYNIMQDKKE